LGAPYTLNPKGRKALKESQARVYEGQALLPAAEIPKDTRDKTVEKRMNLAGAARLGTLLFDHVV
jgi:hypothetical protein